MSLTGSNASNIIAGNNSEGCTLFAADNTEVSNSTSGTTVSATATSALTLNGDNTFAATISDRTFTSDLSKPYLKVPVMIFTSGVPASFTIASLSVKVNGAEQEILNLGGFFREEAFTIS